MKCPACQLDQVIVEFHGVEVDLCIDGHGIWFDKDELGQLFDAVDAPQLIHDLEARLVDLPRGRHRSRKRCPRCRGWMRHVAAPGRTGEVILDRCPHGHGIWFDQGELEEVLALELGEDDGALARVREFMGQFVAASTEPPAEDAVPES